MKFFNPTPRGFRIQVCAPLYPKAKTEAWWVVVGDKKKNTLLAIKRVTLQRKTRAKLEFAAPDEVEFVSMLCIFLCLYLYEAARYHAVLMLGIRCYFHFGLTTWTFQLCHARLHAPCSGRPGIVHGAWLTGPTGFAVLPCFLKHHRGVVVCSMRKRLCGHASGYCSWACHFHSNGVLVWRSCVTVRQITIRETPCLPRILPFGMFGFVRKLSCAEGLKLGSVKFHAFKHVLNGGGQEGTRVNQANLLFFSLSFLLKS